MLAEENKAIVQLFINEFQNHGNEDLALEILAENFIDHSAIPPFTPDRMGVINLFRMLRSSFSGLQAEIEDQIAEGDKVTTRKTFYGTHTGEFFGVPSTNRPIQLGVIDILQVENGKFTDHWCQVDFAGLMQQITN